MTRLVRPRIRSRKTYEIFAAYWPYYDEDAPHGGIAKLFKEIKKYAVSRSGEVDTSWQGSVLLRDIADVKRLKQEDGPGLVAQGSTELVHACSPRSSLRVPAVPRARAVQEHRHAHTVASSLLKEPAHRSHPVLGRRHHPIHSGGGAIGLPTATTFRPSVPMRTISPDRLCIAGYASAGVSLATQQAPRSGFQFRLSLPDLGGPAPVRRYLPDLIDRVLDGQINPGKVFDLTLPLQQFTEDYPAMDERRAIKTLLRP
jgi:hypothetical protein